MTVVGGDFELLERWAGGDHAAAEALIGKYFRPLYRFFRNKLRDGHEDLVQQTLLACLEGRARFLGHASFRTYLFQTARFQLYAHLRKRRAAPSVGLDSNAFATRATSPTAGLARAEEKRLLLEALRRLPLHDQIVLELQLWESLTGPEIAEVLGIPEPTVRSRLRRALSRLRNELHRLEAGNVGLRDTSDNLEKWAARLSIRQQRDS